MSECDGMTRFTDYAVALQQKIARLSLLTLITGASNAVQTVQRMQRSVHVRVGQSTATNHPAL